MGIVVTSQPRLASSEAFKPRSSNKGFGHELPSGALNVSEEDQEWSERRGKRGRGWRHGVFGTVSNFDPGLDGALVAEPSCNIKRFEGNGYGTGNGMESMLFPDVSGCTSTATP